MNEIWLQILLAIVTALLAGGGAAWFLLRSQRRKLNAEAKKADSEGDLNISAAWSKFVESIQQELADERIQRTELEERVADLEYRLSEQDAIIQRLHDKNTALRQSLEEERRQRIDLEQKLAEERQKRLALEKRLDSIARLRDGD